MSFMKKKAKLSKGVLDMKFMKRSKERIEQEIEEDQRRILYGDEGQSKGSHQVITDANYSACDPLLFGRMSFNGFNPEIEKLMASELAVRQEEADKEKEAEIDDQEMAFRYGSLNKTIAKKFQSKRQRSQAFTPERVEASKKKKANFKRPVD